MPRRNTEPEKAPNHERWLITYSDLITLLMIFFILLYTISNVNSKKFAQLSASMSEALLGQNSGKFIGEAPGPFMIQNGKPANQAEVEELEKAKKEIDKMVKEEGLEGKVEVSQESRGLVISLKEALLFESGSAVINDNAKNIILKISNTLKKTHNQIRIEGHTDNLPIHNALFASNWELSTTRATNVVRLMINSSGLDPANLSATGYGEYRPIVANTNETNRAKNRRVDIVVMRQIFDIAEPEASNEDKLNQLQNMGN